MSRYAIPISQGADNTAALDELLALVTATIRAPEGIEPPPEAGYVFEPDLTPEQHALFMKALEEVFGTNQPLSSTEYRLLRQNLRILRDTRQAGRNAYVNMTEGDRNRLTFDCIVAITEVLLLLARTEDTQ